MKGRSLVGLAGTCASLMLNRFFCNGEKKKKGGGGNHNSAILQGYPTFAGITVVCIIFLNLPMDGSTSSELWR